MYYRYTSACSNNIRDSIQASMRVRHIKSYPRYIGSERFDVLSRARLRNILDGREGYAQHHLAVRGDSIWAKRELLEEWCLTAAENNTSAFLHRELLTAYLKLCGYELEESMLGLAEAVEAHVDAIDYHEIPDIKVDAHKRLEVEIHRGAASSEDKLQYLIKAFSSTK